MGPGVAATHVAVDGLAMAFSGAAGGRVEVDLNIGPAAMPEVTVGCWAKPLAFNQADGNGSGGARPMSFVLSGARETSFDRALGIRSHGVDKVQTRQLKNKS